MTRASKPPGADDIGRKLTPYCRKRGISRLELFGSVARRTAGEGSDIDLLATFQRNPGLDFYAMESEVSEILGVPVHLLTRKAAENMTNPVRRQAILSEARVIYHARRVC